MIYCEDCSSYECGCPERKEIESLHRQLDAKQAEVDALMLEYCPSEMSQEQLDTWAAHQRPSEWKTNDELRQQLAERDRYPVAWMTTDEDGSPAMLFFDKQEALMFSGDDGPVPLYKEANNRRRQAGVEVGRVNFCICPNGQALKEEA